MEELKRLRDAIDAIDGQLVGLLNDRARLAQEIGRIKERDGRPVYVPERAEHLVTRLASQSQGPLGEQAIRAIYTEIMSAALALEKEMVVVAFAFAIAAVIVGTPPPPPPPPPPATKALP